MAVASAGVRGRGEFKDNCDLIKARALVAGMRDMQDVPGFPPDRVAAQGIGEYCSWKRGTPPRLRRKAGGSK